MEVASMYLHSHMNEKMNNGWHNMHFTLGKKNSRRTSEVSIYAKVIEKNFFPKASYGSWCLNLIIISCKYFNILRAILTLSSCFWIETPNPYILY